MEQFDKEAYLIKHLDSSYVGDDAAVVGDTLYSMDAFFEDTHFKRAWMSMEQIGCKAMLVNLSDAVAMNAVPKYALVTISLPPEVSKEEILALTQSLDKTAKVYGCEIIGGDTVASDKLHLSITIVSKSQYPLRRKGLQEGDLLAYTGVLGQSKRDLDILLSGGTISEDSRFYRPILRQQFIHQVRDYLHVGMDISDGLFCDTNTLLNLNNIGFVETKKITVEVGSSGEEYEMLIGFSAEVYERVLEIAKETNTPLTLFGKVVKNDARYGCKSHHF